MGLFLQSSGTITEEGAQGFEEREVWEDQTKTYLLNTAGLLRS